MNDRALAQVLEGLSRPRVLICGDLILDRYGYFKVVFAISKVWTKIL